MITTYKSTSTAKTVRMWSPDHFVTEGIICYGVRAIADVDEYNGECDFFYETSPRPTLTIASIAARPDRSGLGALMIVDLLKYTQRVNIWPMLSRVVADSVLDTARQFYRQIGFRPSSDEVDSYNDIAPPPEEDVIFSRSYFHAYTPGGSNSRHSVARDNIRRAHGDLGRQHGDPLRFSDPLAGIHKIRIKDPRAKIYQGSAGQSVTIKRFGKRIDAGRETWDWEAAPVTLRSEAQKKSKDWVKVPSFRGRSATF